jgi:hypothetical protein
VGWLKLDILPDVDQADPMPKAREGYELYICTCSGSLPACKAGLTGRYLCIPECNTNRGETPLYIGEVSTLRTAQRANVALAERAMYVPHFTIYC